MRPTVVDVSVFVDYFVIVEGKEDRHRIAVEFLNRLSDRPAHDNNFSAKHLPANPRNISLSKN